MKRKISAVYSYLSAVCSVAAWVFLSVSIVMLKSKQSETHFETSPLVFRSHKVYGLIRENEKHEIWTVKSQVYSPVKINSFRFVSPGFSSGCPVWLVCLLCLFIQWWLQSPPSTLKNRIRVTARHQFSGRHWELTWRSSFEKALREGLLELAWHQEICSWKTRRGGRGWEVNMTVQTEIPKLNQQESSKHDSELLGRSKHDSELLGQK